MPQCPHHITQRGNESRNIFFTPEDREVYLGLLKKYAELHRVDLLGFCLMTNHVHLVLLPKRADSLAKLLRDVQMRYSQYRHAIERGSGHLWQGRYYSCAVEPERLGPLMRYVELNPVRAGLVAESEVYRWSSAATHLGAADPWNILALAHWQLLWTPQQWSDVLRFGNDEYAAIRQATYGGRPLGSEEFVIRLERFLQRPLKPKPPGRPKLEKAQAA